MTGALQLMKTAGHDFATQEHKHFIANEWCASIHNQSFSVIDPSSKKAFATAQLAGKDDVNLAVNVAQKSFETGVWWKNTPSERAQIMWRIASLIDEHKEILAELESLDNGKPVKIARLGDVALAADHFRYYAGLIGSFAAESSTLFGSGLKGADFHAYTRQEPVGVAALITPWNFPLLIACWKLAPALAAGCSVILKPSEETPLTATYLMNLIRIAGMPAGVVNLLNGDGSTGALLSAHSNVDKVSFTGSTEVGKLILQASAGNLKRVSLELGGKSPVIVFEDADLDAAIKNASNAIFHNQGECCTAGSRLYVHESIYEPVVEGLKKRAQAIKLGVGMDESTQMGPLVSQGQQERVLSYIRGGKEAGAQIFSGAGAPGDGYYVSPTLIYDVKEDMKVVKEEIFGPVVCVSRFKDEEEVLAKANDSVFGLAAGIFTKDLSRAHRVSARIKAGTVWVNTYNVFDAALPFGGYKQSGFGREMGVDGLKLYTEKKSVCVALGKK